MAIFEEHDEREYGRYEEQAQEQADQHCQAFASCNPLASPCPEPVDFPAEPENPAPSGPPTSQPEDSASLGKRAELESRFETQRQRQQELETVKRQRRRADKEIKADEYRRQVAVMLRRSREKRIPLESLVDRMTNHRSCLGRGNPE